ncbi:pilus assembly protein N-terminal domain-containing protein [Paucibacter sp. DJ1R-11]|uniref:pilus assembly protein N-terminal domain-containing protein n=1 Tax=Paucibacter sp. DJ1R-11 TaxID=2893556 RepID=UPI0021E38C31|nr:pilus assembly protein N-terminal domain-containing protein [Paucibacter sp. DJ1R-11]
MTNSGPKRTKDLRDMHSPHFPCKTLAQSRRHAGLKTSLNLSLALALTLPGSPSLAQPAAASGNGYGEQLKASSPGTAGAGKPAKPGRASINPAPYEPIKNSGDSGHMAEIEMFVGESRVFPAPGVARIAVGNGSLMSAAALDEKEVILFANGVGTSSLFIWNADGRYQRVKINIVPGDTSRYAREIAAFLSGIPNAKASVVGSNIIVEGDQLSDRDLAKIDELAKRYPQIVNFTNRVGWEQMVAIDVKVVEFPTSLLRETGLKWSGTGGTALGAVWSPIRRGQDGPYQVDIRTGTGNAPPITNPDGGAVLMPKGLNILSALNMGLNAQLNLLAQEGRASVLAEPQLSARNGSRASFVAGGEIPYAVSTRDGVVIQFKTYGVKLNVQPRVDAHGNIRATIESEVSSIDRSVSTVGGPALLTRKTETEFNVRGGETIVLSGLLQRETSNDVDKLPVLGDIPVLGALFRSKRYQNKETELVVFVTPSLVTPDSSFNRDRVERTTERLEQRMGPSPYLSDPLQPATSYDQPRPAAAASAAADAQSAAPAPTLMPAPPQTPVISRAEEGALLRVKLAQQTLRSRPSRAAPGLLTLEAGATVTLQPLDPQLEDGQRWIPVRVGQLQGWLPEQALAPWQQSPGPGPGVKPATPGLPSASRSAAPTLGPLPQAALLSRAALDASRKPYRVQADKLALRLTPDVNAGVLTRAYRGERVQGLDLPPQGAWVAVQLEQAGPQGQVVQRGWVLSQWLLPELAPATP